jgi:hypothetical protein
MSQPGLSVMLGMLCGNEESVKAMKQSVDKTIASIRCTDDALYIGLEDGSTLTLADQGQSCCEARYMRTDDDLSYYVGAVLRGAEVRDAPSLPTEYDCHDVQFLVVHTDKGDFTMSNHNEHNGYYGGFYIQASLTEAK